MARSKKTARAKPHSKKKVAERDRAAMTPDEQWVEDIIGRMLAGSHPRQDDVVADPAKRISLLWGRGVGKTTVLRVRALIKMLRIPGALIAYVATSRPTARKLNWLPLKKLLDQLGVSDEFEFHETRMECSCKRTGSIYQFIGADDVAEVEKLRGQPFNEVQIDEAASHDNELLEYMLDECVAPRLGERDGCIVLAGTPGHFLRGLFYDATLPGSTFHRPYIERDDPTFAKWIGWSSHSCELLDVVSLPGAEVLYPAMIKNWAAALEEKERHQWSDDNPKWLREYRRRWAANNTTAMYTYRARDENAKLFNRWEPLGLRKLEGVQALKAVLAALPKEFNDYLFGYGYDLGSRDPFALTIKAFSPTDPRRRIWHVYSFEKRRMYPRTIAELLIGEECVKKALRGEVYEDLGGLYGVTGWPVAQVADLAGLGEMILDELANTYGIRIKPAEKAGKFGAIEVYNGDLVDERMYILADSVLETQLSTLQWKPDEYGVPKEDKKAENHSADAATYIRTEIGTMFSGPAAEPKKTHDDKAQPRQERAKPPSPADTWTDAPVGSKKRGEFDVLLSDSDFGSMNWGND